VLARNRTGSGHHHRWHLQEADHGHEPGQGQAQTAHPGSERLHEPDLVIERGNGNPLDKI
jgi:hypothetical protein